MTLQEIRSRATELTKMVDEFVNETDEAIKTRERELAKKIKEYAVLQEREKLLEKRAKELDKLEKATRLERENVSGRTEDLITKEKAFNAKRDRINKAINL